VNKIKLSLPPFIHSGDSIYKWRIDLITAILPVSLFLYSFYFYKAKIFLVVFVTFILFGNLVRYFLKKQIDIRSSAKYVLSALIISLIVPEKISGIVLFFASLGALLFEEVLFDEPGRNLIPSFIVCWLFTVTASGLIPARTLPLPAVFFSAAGLGYLVVKGRVSVLFCAGILIGTTIFNLLSDFSVERIVFASVAVTAVMTYPGVIPVKDIWRFGYGVITAILIFKFGVSGAVIAVFLTPVFELI